MSTGMRIYLETIARVCHEANRVLQITHGDTVSPHWVDFPKLDKAIVVNGVEKALAGATPAELHEEWCLAMFATGWTFGPVKNAKAKTHPCLVPYENLPAEQQVKDHLFHAIVRSFAAAVEPPNGDLSVGTPA